MSFARRRPALSRVLVATVLPVLMLATAALAAPAAQAQRIGPTFFGMHPSGNGSLPGVSVGAIRLWDIQTTWRDIETAPRRFDFTRLDAAWRSALNAHLRPMIVLGQTPKFYASNQTAPGAFGPGASSMPDLTAWKRYVGAVAARYGNSVDYQVWNEPNVVNYWTGSVSQMATLTVTASQVIRQKVHGATVVAPSFPLRLSEQQRWFRSYWGSSALGHTVASQVDVVSANLYPLDTQAPESSLKLLTFARAALPRAARTKPIWNTEINYGLRGGPAAKPITEAKQAAYVVRTLVLDAASPIRRVYWYRWNVGPIANTHLVAANGSMVTRAGKAWNVARSWLIGTKITSCHRATTGKLRGVYTCLAHKGRREVRRVYWKPSGRAARVTTVKTTKAWSTMDGRTKRHRGPVRLTVGQYPVMVSSRR